MPCEEVLIIGERRSTGEQKYHVSNLPADTPIKTQAAAIKARGVCEQAQQQLKEDLALTTSKADPEQGYIEHIGAACASLADGVDAGQEFPFSAIQKFRCGRNALMGCASDQPIRPPELNILLQFHPENCTVCRLRVSDVTLRQKTLVLYYKRRSMPSLWRKEHVPDSWGNCPDAQPAKLSSSRLFSWQEHWEGVS